ncbi:MAG TPA: hypothetical protein VLB50_02035 [Ignavibacteriaceae bacterium]|nr:hypothetical protein [Ignavibacteriaceae bacterium]
MVREYIKNGLLHLFIGNNFIEAVFFPQLGSKMISFINKKTGTEFLLENQDEEKTYKIPFYGADYSKFDASGFDECFPTIEASELTVETGTGKQEKINFPDHGELWSKEWSYEIIGDSILFTTSGVNAVYGIRKLITLNENRLIINYNLVNNSSFPLNYIWSAHPLLAVDEGDKIIMPSDIDKLFLNWASDINIGTFGQYIQWSDLNDGNNGKSFFKINSRSMGIALKGFTDTLKSGFAGLFRLQKNESILISFDSKKLPYLGVWLCYGGWPVESKKKHFTIALEPTTGRPDSLSESIKRKECSVLGIDEEKNWRVEFSLWEGMPAIND